MLCHRPCTKNCRQNKKNISFKKKAIGSQISRMDFLNDKKLKSENVNFFGRCYLDKLRIDNKCILIGLNSVICTKCSMPIHTKCSISLKCVINDNYYCCHKSISELSLIMLLSKISKLDSSLSIFKSIENNIGDK